MQTQPETSRKWEEVLYEVRNEDGEVVYTRYTPRKEMQHRLLDKVKLSQADLEKVARAVETGAKVAVVVIQASATVAAEAIKAVAYVLAGAGQMIWIIIVSLAMLLRDLTIQSRQHMQDTQPPARPSEPNRKPDNNVTIINNYYL